LVVVSQPEFGRIPNTATVLEWQKLALDRPDFVQVSAAQ
jgi:hypothetical protein